MKHPRWILRLLSFALAGMLAHSWLFPQALLRDCVRPVFSPERQEDGGERLTEENCIELFRTDKSSYKIVWRFFQND